MCMAAAIEETVQGTTTQLTREHCDSALGIYVDEASDSIKSAFDKALKKRRKTQYQNALLIIEALASLGEAGAARIDIHKRIQRKEPKYPEANIKYLLPKLCTGEYGGILRHDSASGRYSFSDPIFRVYALAKFQKRKETPLPFTATDFEGILLKIINTKFDSST
jgi:hypothetical protein